jgi:hypothetical protein
VTTSDSAPCQATAKLRAAIAGDVFVPGEHRYDQARQAWDLLADQRPAAVMLAESAVQSARARAKRIAPQGTGHGAGHMFRHESAVLLCPPLHTAIRGNSGGRARFTFDEPSDQLASFANAAITAVEAELGPKTDALLSHLGAELPATPVSPRA